MNSNPAIVIFAILLSFSSCRKQEFAPQFSIDMTSLSEDQRIVMTKMYNKKYTHDFIIRGDQPVDRIVYGEYAMTINRSYSRDSTQLSELYPEVKKQIEIILASGSDERIQVVEKYALLYLRNYHLVYATANKRQETLFLFRSMMDNCFPIDMDVIADAFAVTYNDLKPDERKRYKTYIQKRSGMLKKDVEIAMKDIMERFEAAETEPKRIGVAVMSKMQERIYRGVLHAEEIINDFDRSNQY